jgi:heat shock protein HspQ
MTPKAKFNIGDVVLHMQQGYRAVIIDIDPFFQASGQYNPQAQQRDFAHQHPWYRLLVDKTSQMTYVEEPLLTRDEKRPEKPIDNPLLEQHNNNRRLH